MINNKFKIIDVNIKNRTIFLINHLLKVWESSVKTTHNFLTEDKIKVIGNYVRKSLKEILFLIIIENINRIPVGFMGIKVED